MTPCNKVLPEGNSFVLRLREALLTAELDCGCRDLARNALDRIVTEGALIQAESYLSEGRSRREAIRSFTDFRSELDELGPDESDLTSFEEAARLFDEFGKAALAGAVAVRGAAASIRAVRNVQEIAP